ncbi:MAG: NYN domain-containing protein [Nocardioidaceae bacterium]
MILVDAGYLVAAAAQVIVGTSLRRSVIVDWVRLVDGIKQGVASLVGESDLLRVLWYDAGRDRGSAGDAPEHGLISLLPDVKLRLGRLNNEGAQKGVDTRIALDMVNLAARSSVSDIFLVSGDDDLTEAVDVAQEYGVRVTLYNVPDEGVHLGVHATAVHLAQSADGCRPIARELLEEAITPATRPDAVVLNASPDGGRPGPATPTPADLARLRAGLPRHVGGAPGTVSASASPNTLRWHVESAGDDDLVPHIADVTSKVVAGWLASATRDDIDELRSNRPIVPAEVDRTLLMDLVGRGGDRYRYLGEGTRHELRDRFWSEFDAQAPAQSPSL